MKNENLKSKIFEKLKKVLAKIQKNVSLKNYTTFRIGGRAKFFFIAKTKGDLIKAIAVAKKNSLPFFVLGGGSNLLINDKGFSGLVIKNEARNFKIKNKEIIAESGAILAEVINASIKAGLSGIVEGSGIPGTIGGAVYGNAGWPKGTWAIGNFVKEVKLLMPDGQLKKVDKKWLSFKYRSSRLKKIEGSKPVILEIVLELKKNKKKTLEKKQQEILKSRTQKIPFGPSAGSIFKNPFKKPAGYFIEKCGLKGKKIGRAQISEKHANFIINLGGAKAKDVLALIKLIKEKVKEKFGIELEEEIQLL